MKRHKKKTKRAKAKKAIRTRTGVGFVQEAALKRVGISYSADSGKPVVRISLDDEVVVHPTSQSGESRPRPVGEKCRMTVEVRQANPGSTLTFNLTHANPPQWKRSLTSGTYEGAITIQVKE